MVTLSMRGASGGAIRIRSRTAGNAARMPTAPPATASTRASVRNWRSRRPRVAPSTVRTEISRERATARESSRLAMLAHAMSATKPTASMRRTKNLGTSSPIRSSIAGLTLTLQPALSSRVLALELGGDARQVLLRLLDGHAVAQARHREEAPVAARFRLGGKRRRDPGVDLLAGEEEVCRHDAHDGVGDAVETQRRSDDRGIAGEAALPQPIAQDHHRFGAGIVLLLAEVPAQRRCAAHDPEHVGGGGDPEDPLGLALVAQVVPSSPSRG